MTNQSGFGVLNVLLGVALTGVLATYALPQVAGQAKKVELAEVTQTLQPAMEQMAQQFALEGTMTSPIGTDTLNDFVYGNHVDLRFGNFTPAVGAGAPNTGTSTYTLALDTFEPGTTTTWGGYTSSNAGINLIATVDHDRDNVVSFAITCATGMTNDGICPSL